MPINSVPTAGAQKILEVASRLFYQHGIYNVGVDTIAAESGFTKRTLYDRFGSKDQLIAIHLKARHQRWWSRMEERLALDPAYAVVQEHKRLVLKRLTAFIEDQQPRIDNAERVAQQVFLLMEGAIVHLGVDGDDRLFASARDMAKQLISNRFTQLVDIASFQAVGPRWVYGIR